MITKEFRFPGKRGVSLAGKLDTPDDGKISAYTIYAHCFTCSMELKSIAHINSALTNHSIAVLRYDMTGIGESEGSFPDSNFTTQIEDVLAAAKYLEENYPVRRDSFGE